MLPEGIVASSVTPFHPSGEVAWDLLPAHIEWLLAEGVDGLSPLGSSGEFAALEIETRKRVLERVVEINRGRVPIIVGTHHYSTPATVELSRHAAQAGADGLLITPPYYMSPSVGQVMDHYRAVAAATPLPIVVYHNVPNTNVDLRTEHLVQLFREGAIAGVKMSNPQPDRIAELLQATGGACTVYAGIDAVAFEGLCHGAHGWISGIPSIVPQAARRLYDAIRASDLLRARDEWSRLAPLMRLQFNGYLRGGLDPNWFSVMKAALNLIGPPVNDPLPPIQPLAEEYRTELMGLLETLGYEVRRR
jgi:4-hydroxy-tetrahydrodipicolinate synthase